PQPVRLIASAAGLRPPSGPRFAVDCSGYTPCSPVVRWRRVMHDQARPIHSPEPLLESCAEARSPPSRPRKATVCGMAQFRHMNTATTTLTPELLQRMDAYWRAANY